MAKESCKSDDEIELLLKHYGKDGDESVTYFKEVLENIGIHDLYKKYRQKLSENMSEEMNSSFGKARGQRNV